MILGASLRFEPSITDMQVEVHGREQLAAAIRAVEDGCATIITLHREGDKVTRYIFNWRNWRMPAPHGRRTKRSLLGAPRHLVQQDFLDRYAKRVMKLPREYFR